MKLVDGGAYGSSRVIYGDTDSMFVVCPGSFLFCFKNYDI